MASIMELISQLDDKKTAESALVALTQAFESEGRKHAPLAARFFAQIVDKTNEKDKKIYAAAINASKAAVAVMDVNATSMIVPVLVAGLGTKAKQPQKETCLAIIEGLANNAPLQISRELILLIGLVADLMNDIKKEVRTAASSAMTAICGTTGNKDIEPFIPTVIRANADIKSVPECVEALAGCIFVQNVEGPVLAVTTPVLQRGLNERDEQVKRKCCVILDNMCKLVEDPKEVLPLMPRLQPLLKKTAEAMSDPEARAMAERAYATLMKAAGDVEDVAVKVDREAAQAEVSKLVEGDEDTIKYAANLAASMTDLNIIQPEAWEAALKDLFADNAWVETLRASMANALGAGKEEEDDDEEGEDLYKGNFTLAYGSITLLRDTRLRLKKNMVYGLLGGNNCGKTTLMRAIANEQVEGFPKKDELRTVFVEHEIEEREVGLHQEGGVEGVFCEGCEPSMLPGDKGKCWFCNESWPCSQQAWPVYNVDLSGADWVVDTCNNVYELEPKIVRADAVKVMEEIGFGNQEAGVGLDRAADLSNGVTTYSGGWKMKMQLCAAQMMNADILMLDEPTGHLDVNNIIMIKNWLRAFPGTIIATSHDSGFLNDMTTHIIDFEERKLKVFKGEVGSTLDRFVDRYPEKRSYFELKNDKVKFVFPEPGPLEGVKSKGKTILKMVDATFTYPTKSVPTIFDINVQVCMLSRIAIIGANGAGKSTAIKLLVGEAKPGKGTVWKAPGMRMAYVAQHAFHHLEKHLTKTPVQYILQRFAGNDDAESLEFKNREASEDEEKLRAMPWCVDIKSLELRKCLTTDDKEGKADRAMAIVPEAILNRRKNKAKKYEYETKWQNKPVDAASWIERETLIAMGFIKLVQREDEKQAAAAGLMSKQLTQPAVEKHLAEFAISAEAASHTNISALSGGQKVKVVIAAAMWQNPHILILDEPTNYLDREGLGALTMAIKDFGGGIIIISHNREFADTVANEKWVMDKGRLRAEGGVDMSKDVDFGKGGGEDEVFDGAGNKIDVKRDNMSDKDKKKKIKEMEKKLKDHNKKECMEEEAMYEMMDLLEKLKSEVEGLKSGGVAAN